MEPTRDQLCLEGIFNRIDQKRFDAYVKDGCGYWGPRSVNTKNCHFPRCFCYPFWQKKYNLRDDKK